MDTKQLNNSERLDSESYRLALGIEYIGSDYHGWQRQSHAASVQTTLEKTLSTIANEPIQVICAGRTDTGVHATNQVVHFDSLNKRPSDAWLRGANSLLPPSISIRFVQAVDHDFHARFSATSRSYLYIIDNGSVKPAILNDGLTWHSKPLNIDNMNSAAQCLLGEHDFTSFRSSQCQSKTAFRSITQLEIEQINGLIIIKVSANAFLHHMVRNIAGVLLEIGDGRRKADWAKTVLEVKNRSLAGITASPKGLYLAGVTYPSKFNIPSEVRSPVFFR